jgi:hypothetical protein
MQTTTHETDWEISRRWGWFGKLLDSPNWPTPRRLLGTRYVRGSEHKQFTVDMVSAYRVAWLDEPGNGLLIPAGTPIYHLNQDEYAFDAPYAVE